MRLDEALNCLEDTVTSISELVQAGNSTKNRAKLLNATIRAKEETQTFIKSFSSAKFNVPRKHLKAVNNTLNGLENGLGNKEFGSQYLQATLSNMASAHVEPVEAWMDSRSQELQKEQQSPENLAMQEVFHGDFKTGLERLKALSAFAKVDADNNVKDLPEYAIKEEIEALKKQAKAYLKRYAKELTKPVNLFTVVRMPVVAVFENFRLNDEKFLKRTGIPHTKFGPYFTVFEKQSLLAVSRKGALSADGVGNTSVKSVKTRKSQLNRTKALMQFVDSTIDQLNARSSVQFSRVSESFLEHPTKSDIFYVWIMPTIHAKKLRQDNSKGLKMDYWGFPWTTESLNELSGS